MIQASIDAMLRPGVEETVRQAAGVSEEWQAYLRGELLRRLGAQAEATGTPGPANLKETARREGLSFLALVENGSVTSRWADPALSGAGIASEDLASWAAALAVPGREPDAESRVSGSAIVACGVVPLQGSERYLAAGAVLPRSAPARELTGFAEAYRALRAQRRDLALRQGGRLVSFGRSMRTEASVNLGTLFWQQLNVLGSMIGSPRDFAAMLDFVAGHRIVPIVDSTYPLDEGREAFRRMKAGQQFGKLVLTIP